MPYKNILNTQGKNPLANYIINDKKSVEKNIHVM